MSPSRRMSLFLFFTLVLTSVKCFAGYSSIDYEVRVSAAPVNTGFAKIMRPEAASELARVRSVISDGPCAMAVDLDRDAKEVVVRPLSRQVKVMRDGRRCAFTLPGPGQYTFEADGPHHAVHIFVDAPKDCRTPRGKVIRYTPGEHRVGRVMLESDTTVIIERGARVYGCFMAVDAENIAIVGGGIIDGSEMRRDDMRAHPLPVDFYKQLPAGREAFMKVYAEQRCADGPVRLFRVKNARVEGVTLLDPPLWSLIAAGCDGFVIDNVKVIGWRYNSDGFNLCNTRNAVIRNSFLRCFDDCVVLKGICGYDAQNCENIRVENCVIWCDWGRNLEIGAETNAPEYRDIIFRNCDLIHGSTVFMDINHNNRAFIHDILFEDIRVEYTRYQLADVTTFDPLLPYPDPPPRVTHPLLAMVPIRDCPLFSKDNLRGRVRGVRFKGISVVTDPEVPVPQVEVTGYDADHRVEDVSFTGFTLNGKPWVPEVKTNAFTSGIYAGLKPRELTLVENGVSDYVIAVADDQDEAMRVQEAVDALRDYVKAATGCTLASVRESEVGDRPAFYLGRTAKGVAAGIPYERFVDYVNCRKIIGRDIFIAGNDASANIRGELQQHDREYLGHGVGLNLDVKDQSYRRWHGTLKAALAFLEDAGVVQFLMPGENGLNIAKLDRLAVPDDLNVIGQAQIPYSNCRCYGGLHSTVAFGQLEIPYNKTWGGHPFPVAVPRAKYEKTNPEYFILKDGVRRPDFGPAGGGHHCVSNPEVFELFMAEMKRQYDLGYRWIQVGPTDGQVPCECEACRKMHPDPHERQWIFYRRIAEAAETRLPGATMVLLSYDFTSQPPTSFERFPDNVAIELCIWDRFHEKFAEWEKFRDVPKIAYVYFFGAYHAWAVAPTRSPKYIADSLRVLRDNNVKCIFKCGWAEDLGLEACIAYVYAKLLEDPDRDPEALVDRFCKQAYGKAEDFMKRFWRTLYANLDTSAGHSVIDETKKRPHNPEQMYMFSYTPGTLRYMGRMLDLAEGTAGLNDKERARIKFARRSWGFQNLRMQSYFVNAAWSATGDPAILEAANRVYDARERFLDGWYDEQGKLRREPGFDWHYMRGLPREKLVNGGGAMVPNFPFLFRYGKDNVKTKLAAESAGK